MKICRFQLPNDSQPRVGVLDASGITDLSGAGITTLEDLLEQDDPAAAVPAVASTAPLALHQVTLLAPVEQQEVWAAGVTYLRSKRARMEESEFSASAYDRVYDAPRPELFFKSVPQKVVPPGAPVGIRRDARWNVPEPELALVLNSRGHLVGFTIGNDMSSRDIEGENLLYLPQAKVYKASCALGPCIVLGANEKQAREWAISITIERDGAEVFAGQTSVNQIKRSFDELVEYLLRSQEFPRGAVLLTGTGVVPSDEFTLEPHDLITINISGIGTLQNQVMEV